MKLSYSIVHDLAVFSSIGLVTVSWASTTQPTIASLATLRSGFTSIVLLFLVWGFRKYPSKTSTIIAGAGLFGLLACYSVLILETFTPALAGNATSHIRWIILSSSIAAVFYLTPHGKPIISDRASSIFIIFAFLILIYTAIKGGLLVSGFPRFVFELENSQGSISSYSQGISKFYGLAAIFSATLLSRSSTKLHLRYACIFSLVAFLILSLIGGGRGDFLFSLLVSTIALKKLYAAALFGALGLFGTIYSSAIEELLSTYSILAERFFALTYSLGMRDTLFANGLNLLLDNSACATFGCGVGFFQSYYDYPASLYPHNVLLETVISFGLIFTLSITFFATVGRKRMYALHGDSPNFIFMIVFFFMISLKSGQILTSFLLWGAIIFLTIHGIAFFLGDHKQKAKPSA